MVRHLEESDRQEILKRVEAARFQHYDNLIAMDKGFDWIPKKSHADDAVNTALRDTVALVEENRALEELIAAQRAIIHASGIEIARRGRL